MTQPIPDATDAARASNSLPPNSAAPAIELERRLHPASWFFVLIQQLKQFIVPLLAIFFFGGADRNELWSVIAICLLGVYAIWQYYTYRFHIDSDSLLIRSGLLERSLRQIPFARIQNVAIHQTLLHRIFGVAEVRLESAGGIKPEAEMRVLKLADAMALEALVRQRKSLATASLATTAGATARTHGDVLLSLSVWEVVRQGLISNRGMLVIAGGFAVLSQLSPNLIETVLRSWVRGMFGYVTSYGRGHELAALISMILMFVIALRLFSVALALLQYYGFRLEQQGRRLTIERGLLSRSRTSAPHRRIQTFTLHEGVLHRLFRRRTLEVSTAVLDNGSHSQPRSLRELAPVATPEQCDDLIRHLLPGAQWPIHDWRPLHKRAWCRILLPHVLWVCAIGAGGYLSAGANGALLVALWLPWALILAWKHAGLAGYAVGERAIAVRDGWWTRRWRLAEIDKLQGLQLSRSPLDRWFGMATLTLDTAGGTGLGAPLSLRFLPVADARALKARLAREIASRKLRW
jgi:putative membrane protein